MGAIHDEANPSSLGSGVQHLLHCGSVPVPHADSVVIQKAAKASFQAELFHPDGGIFGNATQCHMACLVDANE